MKNKRLLFLGFNKDYVNPYRNTILSILGTFFDITFYGPGYSSEKDLAMGVSTWYKNQFDFDFVMIDNDVAALEDLKKNSSSLFLMSKIHFNKKIFFDFADQFNSFFLEVKSKKIILGNWDAYHMSIEVSSYIEKTKSYVIDFGGHELLYSESIAKKNNPNKTIKSNDVWYNFLRKNQERIIAVPHIINSVEFLIKPLELRKKRFSIIGVGYPERKEASELMSFMQKVEAFCNKIKPFVRHKLNKSITTKDFVLYKSNYFATILDSHLTYCSGGPLMYPVRKYFEILACGSVPIGWPCSGFSDLGFVDGLNFIVAKKNDDIKKILKTYSLADLQNIANNGNKLIWSKHSDWARTQQLLSTFSLINKGTFKGSFWHLGEYKNR